MTEPLAKSRALIPELLSLAAPTVAQMISYTLMQFVDTWMLARRGPLPATAGSNSGMMAYSFLSLGIGVLWIVNTLASQSFGRKEYHQCGAYLWQGVWFSFAYAVCLLPLLLLAHRLFIAFGHEPTLATWEATYFRISLAGAILKLLGTAFGQFLLAIDKPKSVLLASVCGVSLDALGAWALIFGRLGFHAMGVAGSAWATNIGVAVETTVLIFIALSPSVRLRFGLKSWKIHRAEMAQLLKIGLPSGVQAIADILAWSLFCNWVIGAVGPMAMAANAFMLRYMVVSFMPAIGMSVAVTALVGRSIGRGQIDSARRAAHWGYALTGAYQALCGVCFFVGRRTLLTVFTHDPAVLQVGETYMIFGAIYQLFDALFINYNGALRGAGDTIVPAVITATLNWSINLAGGYLVARHVPQLGPAGPWIIATIYGAIVGVVMLGRFLRGNWTKITLHAPVPVEPAMNVPPF
ncbi:MAG TPA: MATE family efflux transporter [Tepidisphaeraceae bacterium]|nr:MATE family efflux transporter [Tepidisphaeraceae bacterium]